MNQKARKHLEDLADWLEKAAEHFKFRGSWEADLKAKAEALRELLRRN